LVNEVANNRLDGKVALVTGAGTKPPGVGIGCAIAQVLAGAGASVLIVDKDAEHGEVTRGMIAETGGQSEVCVADVSLETDCGAMVRAAQDAFGGLDILVNNAGISKHVTITDTPQELFEEIIGVNLRGSFMACKYAIPAITERGGGSIVNIASVVAIRDAGSSHPAYAASKGGVLGITVDLAGAYGRDNIRVNAILPGMIASPIQASIGSASEEMQRRMNLLGRMGNVWDIAHAAAFLCTDEASYITGLVMPVDGGATVAMPSSAARADRPGHR
jgi:NAD(P)-dependent dehydrogenase (short-subunit alcohol dehydrogenase family)